MTHPERASSLRNAGLRGELSRDHERLDQLFSDLRAAFDADAREDAARLWGELDRGLSAHLEFEERHVLPAFRAVDSAEGDRLLREHDLIRHRLTELGVAVDLHTVRAEIVADFIALLRAHAHGEDDLLYRWAERELPASTQEKFLPASAGRAPGPQRSAVPGNG